MTTTELYRHGERFAIRGADLTAGDWDMRQVPGVSDVSRHSMYPYHRVAMPSWSITLTNGVEVEIGPEDDADEDWDERQPFATVGVIIFPTPLADDMGESLMGPECVDHLTPAGLMDLIEEWNERADLADVNARLEEAWEAARKEEDARAAVEAERRRGEEAMARPASAKSLARLMKYAGIDGQGMTQGRALEVLDRVLVLPRVQRTRENVARIVGETAT